MSASAVSPDAATSSVLDLLVLEDTGSDAYRSTLLFASDWPIYGGQVAAQALFAAGSTIPAGRAVHSLHGYFLRSGDPARPVDYRVERDRDGRSYSSRRVVARQDGHAIFSMAASFCEPEEGLDRDGRLGTMPDPPPAMAKTIRPSRCLSIETHVPAQPHPTAVPPTRLWARCSAGLPDDPLVQSCVLAYISDMSNGLSPFHIDGWVSGSSLDHAVWFHRPIRVDDWVLIDLTPVTAGAGRGLYTGVIRDADGHRAASFAQESLFRRPRGRET
ncbi:acyl-CoA thioesterase [Pseudonocardia sp. GCM10023141]|uniref:acyl-CoA thioesterase n=1 Tax=Pseudonocardia sp. GCM10023141 TaxID=3252653 RepID=UPI003613EF82